MRGTAIAALLAALGVPAAAADFTDVTSAAGLAGVPVFRISVADLNGDGWPDLLLHTKPDETTGDVLDKQVLFLNEAGASPGQRVFVDHTAGSGIRSNRQGTTSGRHSSAAIFADVDNDGDLDMFTGVYVHRNWTLNLGKNELLLNDGSARFTLAPGSPFHLEPTYNTAAEVFLDYDLDGKVDVWTGNWYCPSTGSGNWCVAGLGTDGLTYDQLYRGDGAGGFANVTALAWSYQYFLLSFTTSSTLRALLRLFSRLTSFYLKYADYYLVNRPGALDAASGFYFMGRRAERVLPDRDLIKLYRGQDSIAGQQAG